jgi:hypothetical protein
MLPTVPLVVITISFSLIFPLLKTESLILLIYSTFLKLNPDLVTFVAFKKSRILFYKALFYLDNAALYHHLLS